MNAKTFFGLLKNFNYNIDLQKDLNFQNLISALEVNCISTIKFTANNGPCIGQPGFNFILNNNGGLSIMPVSFGPKVINYFSDIFFQRLKPTAPISVLMQVLPITAF